MECSIESALEAARDELETEIATSGPQIEAAQRLRYKVYCEERGFEPGENGLEQDEFDHVSRHVLVRSRRSGQVLGTVRVVLGCAASGASSFPMNRVCERYVLSPLPAMATGEISRFALTRDRPGVSPAAAALMRLFLMRGIVTVSGTHDLTHWCAIMERSLLRRGGLDRLLVLDRSRGLRRRLRSRLRRAIQHAAVAVHAQLHPGNLLPVHEVEHGLVVVAAALDGLFRPLLLLERRPDLATEKLVREHAVGDLLIGGVHVHADAAQLLLADPTEARRAIRPDPVANGEPGELRGLYDLDLDLQHGVAALGDLVRRRDNAGPVGACRGDNVLVFLRRLHTLHVMPSFIGTAV